MRGSKAGRILRSFPRKRESKAICSDRSIIAPGPRFRADERKVG
jgi:hypothetical protein